MRRWVAWTEKQKAKLAEMYDAGMSVEDISYEVGKTPAAVRCKIERLRYDRRAVPPIRQISTQVLDQQHHRLNAIPRDLTGLLLGDPPVGYSALERRG